ncbi:DNA polymerase III subunit delta [Helicobacter salomonis]|uniref:DNA polymerase III subunit delta n=1 Tax=Helicobacter salomonis TaxID=56878 RepID=UPI000CF0CDB0|nr:DNA polymerase III [Helicobacter salomonis]
MYHGEFVKYLEHTTPRVALLYGEYVFYIEHYVQKILDRYAHAQQQRFYFGDYDLKSVLEALSQDSLFGEGVVVCLKLDKKLNAKECHALVEAIIAHPRNALIIGFYPAKNKGEYPQHCKQFGAQLVHPKLKGQIAEVRFFTPSTSELITLLQERARALRLPIDMQALYLLLELHNNDLGIIDQELQKLALSGRPIHVQEVQQEVYGMGAVGTEQLLDSLFEGGVGRFAIFTRLQAEGVDEVELVRALARYFYQLFLFASYLKIHGSIRPKEILGFNPPPALASQLSKRVGQLKATRPIFELLREWHVQCMQGNAQAGWHFLIKVQDYIG